MGLGTIAIDKWARLFQEKCPDSSFTLEIITGAPAKVLNYFEPGFWAAYSDARASEFAQFVKLVEQGQSPLQPMLTASWDTDVPEYKAALTVQQRLDLEQSVRYCREVLGVGTSL